MKKRLNIIVVLLVVITMVSCNNSKSSKPEGSQPVITEDNLPVGEEVGTNDLPNLPLTKLDGTQLMVRNLQGKTILFFFQPDCDHCQREAVQIRENLQAFRDYKVYFISNYPQSELAKFAQEYKLAFEPNFVFAHATIENILNTVGPMPSPTLFIYSDKGRLVKAFKGETPIEQILPAL